MTLESFFPVRNAVICPKWQFTKPASSVNVSQMQINGVSPREASLKHGQCFWPPQQNARAWFFLVGRVVHIYLPALVFTFKSKHCITVEKNSILGLIIAVKQRKSDLLLQQCVRSAVVKTHFPD